MVGPSHGVVGPSHWAGVAHGVGGPFPVVGPSHGVVVYSLLLWGGGSLFWDGVSIQCIQGSHSEVMAQGSVVEVMVGEGSR